MNNYNEDTIVQVINMLNLITYEIPYSQLNERNTNSIGGVHLINTEEERAQFIQLFNIFKYSKDEKENEEIKAEKTKILIELGFINQEVTDEDSDSEPATGKDSDLDLNLNPSKKKKDK